MLSWWANSGKTSRMRATQQLDLWIMAVWRGVKPRLFFFVRMARGACAEGRASQDKERSNEFKTIW